MSRLLLALVAIVESFSAKKLKSSTTMTLASITPKNFGRRFAQTHTRTGA